MIDTQEQLDAKVRLLEEHGDTHYRAVVEYYHATADPWSLEDTIIEIDAKIAEINGQEANIVRAQIDTAERLDAKEDTIEHYTPAGASIPDFRGLWAYKQSFDADGNCTTRIAADVAREIFTGEERG